jgi:hypothetical protein
MNMRSARLRFNRLMVGYTPFGIVTILFSAPNTDSHGPRRVRANAGWMFVRKSAMESLVALLFAEIVTNAEKHRDESAADPHDQHARQRKSNVCDANLKSAVA